MGQKRLLWNKLKNTRNVFDNYLDIIVARLKKSQMNEIEMLKNSGKKSIS